MRPIEAATKAMSVEIELRPCGGLRHRGCGWRSAKYRQVEIELSPCGELRQVQVTELFGLTQVVSKSS